MKVEKRILERIPMRNLANVKVLITYWSETGNTEKVAKAVMRGMKREGLKPVLKTIEKAKSDLLYDYDFICIGSPTHVMLPAKEVMDFGLEKLEEYRQRRLRMEQSPLLPGKYAAVFCTAGGPHTGLCEAVPAAEWLAEFLKHLGFDVKAKWYVVGEFHSRNDCAYNTGGRLGDIRGRPGPQDLARIEDEAASLIRELRLVLGISR